MRIEVDVETKLPKVIWEKDYLKDELNDIVQASNFIVEAAEKKQAPVMMGANGGILGAIETANKGNLRYDVIVNPNKLAVSGESKDYPKFLVGGTGSLKGAPDYGYTPGRVRSNTVKRGIGGIRPNKFPMRAAKEAEPKVHKFVNQRINKLIEK